MIITTMTSVPEKYWFVGELNMKTRNQLARDTNRASSLRLSFSQNGMLFDERSTAYRLFVQGVSRDSHGDFKDIVDTALREFFKYEEVAAAEDLLILETRDPYWFLRNDLAAEWHALESQYLSCFRSDVASVLSVRIARMEWLLSNELTAMLKNDLAKIQAEVNVIKERLTKYREIPLSK